MIGKPRIRHAMMWRPPDLLARLETIILSIWRRIGSRTADFWTVLVGGSKHDLVHLPAWQSLAERDRTWSAFTSDTEWLRKRAAGERDGPLIRSFENAFRRLRPITTG